MPPSHSQDDPTNRHVLVVDDDSSVRKTIVRMIQALGGCVIEADGGREALSLLPSVTPAVVILDLFMPGMDGIETLCAMRANGSKVPIIAITGGTGTEAVLTTTFARKLGAAVVLDKPFRMEQLASALSKALGRSLCECPEQTATSHRPAIVG